MGLMGPGDALDVRARLVRSTRRWATGGVVAGLASLGLVVAAIPVGNASGGGMEGMQLTMALMGAGGLGLVASLAVPTLVVAGRWLAARDTLTEAKRVLAMRATDPAWARLDARIRLCLAQSPDADVRAALERLHARMHEGYLAAEHLAPGSDADLHFREGAARAEDVVGRLHERLATDGIDADTRDALARLEAQIEVETAADRATRAVAAGRHGAGVR